MSDTDEEIGTEVVEPLEGDEGDELEADEGPAEPLAGDGEGDEVDAPDADTPAALGPTEAALERGFKSLEGRAKRYAAGVLEVATENGIPFVPCALCGEGVPGFIIDPRVEPLNEMQVVAVRALLGMDEGPRLEQAPDAETCPTCNGWGEVLTGSKVASRRQVLCPQCRGNGWIGPHRDLTPAEVAALPNLAYEYVEPDNEPPPDVDAWGTPRGHPEYGLSPQYRDAGWQERIEAWVAGEPAPLVTVEG